MSGGLPGYLAALIRGHGPLTVAGYMAEALGNPRFGYYTSRDPFGADGDFITAPEVSQMFGEMLGAWCAAVWQIMDRPDPVNLVEFGPGRGTLMADALRAAGRAPRPVEPCFFVVVMVGGLVPLSGSWLLRFADLC